MRVSKGLALGLVGALLAGAVEAVAGLAVEAVAGPHDGIEVSVPLGAVGDRVLYVSSWRSAASEPWKSGERMGFEIAKRAFVPDKFGTLHDGVHVYLNNWTADESGGLLGREWRVHGEGFEDHSYTIADKTLVFSHYRGDFTTDTMFVNRVQTEGMLGLYGPWDRDSVPGVPKGSVLKWDLALHQGVTYREGNNVDAWARDRLSSEDSLTRATRDATVAILSYEGRMGPPARLGERVALPLTLTGCAQWEKGPAPTPWYGGPGFFGFEMKAPVHVCFEYTEWVAGDSSYPVRMESRLVLDKSRTLERVDELAAFVPGSEPFIWGRGAPPRPLPELERSPASQPFPADGDAPLPYPLSSALAAVEGDPLLVQFKAWKVQHPDAILAGAALRPTQADATQLQWDLVFGTPQGAAFVVATQRSETGGAVKNSAMGELRMPTFDPKNLVAGPITFGAAAQTWRLFLLKEPTQPHATYVSWGFQYMPHTVRCVTSDECSATPHYVRSPPLAHATIAYGQSVRTTGPLTASQAPFYEPFNFIVIDARNLSVPISYLSASEATLTPLSVGDKQPEPEAPASLPAAPASLDFSRGIALSASLILVLLVTYFYPVLKVAATQAGILLPGYAKTEKAQLLNHKLREMLANAIRADPGITPPEMHALSGASWTTVVYHLRQLEKKKVVTSLIDGRHKRYFHAENVPWKDRERLAALRNERTRQLYEILLEEPGLERREVARRLGISRPATYWHFDRLERTGLVGRERVGPNTRFFAFPGAPTSQAASARDGIEVA